MHGPEGAPYDLSHDRRYVTLSVRPQLATVVQPLRRIEQSGSVTIPSLLAFRTTARAEISQAMTVKDLAEILRALEISEATWNRWRAQYGGMKADEAKRLRQLETENARLKKLLAEAELDKAMLKELAEGNF